MPDQDRIDTLTANSWAAEYREDGKVDLNEAYGVLAEASAESGPAIVALLLEWLQQPYRRDDLAGQIVESLADVCRSRYAAEVQTILDAEAERDALWQSCHCTPEQAAAQDERLDDPRRGQAAAINAGR